MGLAKIQAGSHDFIHRCDLSPIAEEITAVRTQFTNLKRIINDTHLHKSDLRNYERGLEYQLNAVARKFQTICPLSRTKRGLINGLGSIIKIITGNLDNKDAERYNNAISTLQENERTIVKTVDQHLSLTSKILKNYDATIQKLSYNQQIIESETNKISTQQKNFELTVAQMFGAKNIIDQLKLVLDTILHLLTDLEVAITFARVNTLYKGLLDMSDMKQLINEMRKYHQEDQMPFTKDEDFLNNFELITVDAFYSNLTVVFILHFPLYHPTNYDYYHLYSIPTTNHTTIIAPTPYLILNSVNYQYLSVPCKILGSLYFCKETSIQSHVKDEDCVTEILRPSKNHARCQHVPIVTRGTFVQQVTTSCYIGVFAEETKISTQCATTQMTTLHGAYLIELEPECKLRTPLETFVNYQSNLPGSPMTLPDVKVTSIAEKDAQTVPLVLERIRFDDLRKLQEEQERIMPLTTKRIHDTTHFWMTPIYIGFVIVVVLVYKYFKYKKSRTPISSPVDNNSSQTVPTPQVFFRP
jgi:hypothetical protein